MIYVTGDTHIPLDIRKLTTQMFPEQRALTKDDYVIICGDFGGVWDGSKEDKYWLEGLNNKSFTTLFVDGNHENFQLLNNEYDVEIYNGGKVHKIMDSVFHLMRGQVFMIDGLRIFTMGGAMSVDKKHRTEGRSWWSEELPSKEEYIEAVINLEANNNTVDYIITHCAPETIQQIIDYDFENNELTEFLEVIKNEVEYMHWYFGHYHLNKSIDEKHTCLYDQIIKLGELIN